MGKELDQLKPVLEAIPREHVAEPQIPVAVFLQEAHDLETLAASPDVHEKLAGVGLDKELLAGLDASIAAARQAQSEWIVAYNRTKSDAERELEDRARGLRNKMADACRWNLRGDRVALATVSAVAAEGGVADLVQDLEDLAHLVETRKAAFAKDRTFDAEAEASRARQLAKELQQGISNEQLHEEQARAKDLRDRAVTHLYDAVSEVREAGRYAFRDDDELRPRFASAYKRHRSKRAIVEHPADEPARATGSGQPAAAAN